MVDQHTNIAAADDASIAKAVRHLLAGELVAFPTETVYGLGGDATNDRAVARIFDAKGRPHFNPLIVHFDQAGPARTQARFDGRADKLAETFWPGPLSLVLPRQPDCTVSLLASAGLETIAVRIPGHPVALSLLAACGRPVAAPSANVSGKVSPTTAAHVAEALGTRVAMVLDAGPCPIGIESTVIDLSGDKAALLRRGAVLEDDVAAVIGPLIDRTKLPTARPGSPGMLASHYAPELPLRLDAREVDRQEALLAFGAPVMGGALATLNLSPSGDLVEAAANLFAMLRTLDRPEFSGIAVMPIPDRGIGRAINDRLRRAAAPR